MLQPNDMRRLKQFALPLLIGALALSLTACDQGLTELNENPNAPTEPTVELVLPHVQQALMEARISSLPDTYAQYRGELLYVGDAIYERPNTNGQWSNFYTDILANANYIRDRAKEQGDSNVQALALIHRAFAFQLMTDMWGPIPYSEANFGRSSGGDLVLNPKYDSQQAVYEGILEELENAVDMIQPGSGSVGSADLIYEGDMEMWKKFANSLRLRLYMRMSEANASMAQSGIQSIYSSGEYIVGNSGNALFEYKAYPNSHPMHQANRLREDDKVASTIIDTLEGLDDPRLRVYAAPNNNNDSYKGLPPGVDKGHGYTNSEVSPFGAYFVSPTHPAVAMTAAEVHFILSEAAARGWISTDAEEHYETGIRSALLMYDDARLSTHLSGFAGDETYGTLQLEADEFPDGITEAEVNTYLSQSGVAWNSSEWRSLIGLQKWLLFYENQSYEGWFEWRRLNAPTLEPGPDALLDQVPVRLPYPENEQSFNNENLQQGIEMLGGSDDMTTSVWWDQ
jgi:hypothetical protein